MSEQTPFLEREAFRLGDAIFGGLWVGFPVSMVGVVCTWLGWSRDVHVAISATIAIFAHAGR